MVVIDAVSRRYRGRRTAAGRGHEANAASRVSHTFALSRRIPNTGQRGVQDVGR